MHMFMIKRVARQQLIEAGILESEHFLTDTEGGTFVETRRPEDFEAICTSNDWEISWAEEDYCEYYTDPEVREEMDERATDPSDADPAGAPRACVPQFSGLRCA